MLVRWNSAIPALFSELEKSFLSDYAPRETVATLVPRADILENKDNFIVRAELPGVPKEKVKITLENSVLTVSGAKNETAEGAQQNYRLRETFHGEFERRFRLSDGIDRQQIKADYKDGVLEVTLPKTKEAQSREIAISLN